MNKTKKSYLNTPPNLVAVGSIILLTSPLIWHTLQYLLTLDCPVRFDGALQCDLGRAFQTFYILITVLAVWILTGIVTLIVGLLKYSNSK